MSECAGSISSIAEQKLLVNRIMCSSGEIVFSLLDVILVLLACLALSE